MQQHKFQRITKTLITIEWTCYHSAGPLVFEIYNPGAPAPLTYLKDTMGHLPPSTKAE